MFLHIIKQKHNYNEIYNNNLTIFKECDYQFIRYNVEFCLCLIKLEKEISEKNIDLLNMIRLTDKYIKIDEIYHLIIFTHSNHEQSTKAILKIEKFIINQYNLYQDKLFNCCIFEKNENINVKEMLLKIGIEIETKNYDYINIITID